MMAHKQHPKPLLAGGAFVAALVTILSVYAVRNRPVKAQENYPPQEALQIVTDAYIQQFNLPIEGVTSTLHTDVTAENAVALAEELTQATRVLFLAHASEEDSPTLFVTFSAAENDDWLGLNPTLPALKQELYEKVLLPGRQVYLLNWKSAVSTANGEPLPPELSFLAASFDSLAVFDSTKGIVYDSFMTLPVMDVTRIAPSFNQIYIPYINNSAIPEFLHGLDIYAPAQISAPSEPTYTEKTTHREIGMQAARLAGAAPPYTEIGEATIINEIADGDQAEDNPVRTNTKYITVKLPREFKIEIEIGDGRYFHHFYNPNSKLGLKWEEWFYGLVLQTIKNFALGKPVRFMSAPDGDYFTSALDWGRNLHTDGLNWENAIRMYDYSPSTKELAYRRLGHVIHLIQDMAQPDHPRLQPHPGSGWDVDVPEINDQILGRLVGYEKLWDEKSGEWPIPASPGCPNQTNLTSLDDFFNSMADRSIERSDWWDKGLHSPNGIELALGLTNITEPYKKVFSYLTSLPEEIWGPEILIDRLDEIPFIPTILLSNPGAFQTMGETLISESTACSAALLRFFYDIVNQPPYVAEVIVRQQGAGFPEDIAYHALWVDDFVKESILDLSTESMRDVMKLRGRKLEIIRDESLQENTRAEIEVHFGPIARDHGGTSKEIDEDSIQVSIGDIEVKKLSFGQEDQDGPFYWIGEFVPDRFSADRLPIKISANDNVNHYPPQNFVLDSDPGSPAKVNPIGSGYQWENYEPGIDQNHHISHKFKIFYHETVTFTNEDADAILAEATSALQDVDQPEDVSCPVRLARDKDEDVAVFSIGNGIINTPSDQVMVMEAPGNVKVVSQINYCDQLISMNLIGCAEFRGDSFIVENIRSFPTAGVLWAHSFGANQGLRNCQSDCAYRLMNFYIYWANRVIDAQECDAFLQPRPVTQLNEFVPLAGQDISRLKTRMPVEEFIHKLYFSGVPYQIASQYGERDVDILIEMLKEPAEEPYWSNIVTTLGMIGNEKAIDPLLEFINKDIQGEITPFHYKAITAAIGSLGYLIYGTGDQKALTFLQESTNPDVWTSRVSWISPFHSNIEERNQQLSIVAILGLGLSGHPEAEKSLLSLLKSNTNLENQISRANTQEAVQEALRALEFIAKEGLSAYYDQSRD